MRRSCGRVTAWKRGAHLSLEIKKSKLALKPERSRRNLREEKTGRLPNYGQSASLGVFGARFVVSAVSTSLKAK